MMNPTRFRALSEAYGSWKIIISSRRIGRMSERDRRVMSRPSKTTLPPVGSRSRMTQRAIVDFPQPDSPTTPRVSPERTVNETPSTALTDATSRWKTIPRVTGKCFFRSSTTRSSLPATGVPSVARIVVDNLRGLRQGPGKELRGLAVLRLLVEVTRLEMARVVADRLQHGLLLLAD